MRWLTDVTRAMAEARQVAVMVAAVLGAGMGAISGLGDGEAVPEEALRLPSSAVSAQE